MSFDITIIRERYRAFLGVRPDRILLTGHSHQAWPDCARDAMGQYFDDSARFVDDKWSEAIFERVERVGRGVLRRSGLDPSDPIAFGRSTHELVYRLLSCFPRDARVVTTTGEFHSLHRQLSRCEEDGLRVTWVDASPRAGLAERLLEAIVPGVDIVAVSAVFFEDSALLEGLGRIVARAAEVGAVPLVDGYHSFNVAPIDLGPAAEAVYLTAGGYKYAAFGEGVCWLRFPRSCTLRPAYTGWFADFEALERPRVVRGEGSEGRSVPPIGYGSGGARFSGATFDASAFYRADAVLTHWDELELGVPELRAISVRQTHRLIEGLISAGFEVVTPREPERRGGFVSVRMSGAHDMVHRLRERQVFVDARGELLRFGPAPYVTDDELDRAVTIVSELRASKT
jgi:kynureninase